MSPETAVQEVLNSHWLPQIAARIQEKPVNEKAARERFYDEMSESDKTEFIDGEVIVPSPARDWHTEAVQNLQMLLHLWSKNFGGKVRSEKALCVFKRNDYEPDIVYFGVDKAKSISGETMKYPVPDFIVEVLSESTTKNDRGVKFEDYEDHGVLEYWIVDPKTQILEQNVLSDAKQFKLALKSNDGDVASRALMGFSIPIRAIFDEDIHQATVEKFIAASK